MQFVDELAGGVVLIRPALQSPDYVPGASGWAIKIGGEAEFNNVIIRGSGTGDPLVVGPDGMPQVVIRTTPTNGLVVLPTNRPIEQNAATLNSAVLNAGAVNERAELQMNGPTVSGSAGGVRTVLQSQPNNGTDVSRFAVQDRAGTTNYLTVDGDQVLITGRPATAERATATATAIRTTVTGEAQPRLTVLADGSLQWGPGTVGPDTNLYRAAAGILQTDDTFVVLGELSPRNLVRGTRPTATDSQYETRAVGDAFARWFIRANGDTWWGDGASAQDVHLYRGSANELRTNANFSADGNLQVGGGAAVLGSLTADNIRHGAAATPAPGGVPAQTSVDVLFADAMPGTPRVVLTPISSAANLNTSNIRWAVTNIATTGFTINCWRDTNVSTNFSYIALST